ncbi:MAG: hypothetical protein ACFFB3_21420 [Candidatus Hodarchaeota archaeon]
MADEIIIFACITLGVLARFFLPYFLKIYNPDTEFSWGNITDGLRYIFTSALTEIVGLILLLGTEYLEKLSELPTSVDIWIYLFAFFFGFGGNELLNHVQQWVVKLGLFPPAKEP